MAATSGVSTLASPLSEEAPNLLAQVASMVFTCAVPVIPSAPFSRRAALFGLSAAGIGLAVVAAGCTSDAPAKSVDQVIGSDPLGPLYTETVGLIDEYDRAIAANPGAAIPLGRLRDEHRQHALALAGLMGVVQPSISPAPNASGASASPGIRAVATPITDANVLSTAEKTAHANAVTACKTAPRTQAAVLAAIAACRATHIAALGAMR